MYYWLKNVLRMDYGKWSRLMIKVEAVTGVTPTRREATM